MICKEVDSLLGVGIVLYDLQIWETGVSNCQAPQSLTENRCKDCVVSDAGVVFYAFVLWPTTVVL